MVLGLREVIAMTAADRRTCWLAGSLPVLPSVVIVLFLRCQELLPGALNVDWSAICEIAEARAAEAVFYLHQLIQLPPLRSGQCGVVAAVIASRLVQACS